MTRYAELKERLGATRIDQYARGAPSKPINPDGPAALTAIEELEDSYDGVMADLESALEVLVRRINCEKDLPSAAQWLAMNYPRFAMIRLSDAAKDALPERERTHMLKFGAHADD